VIGVDHLTSPRRLLATGASALWNTERKGSALMSVLNRSLDTFETGLPKVINPTAHGVIDYAHAAFFFIVGVCCKGSNKRAARAAFATSGFILVQSMLTNYRFGVKPVFSFETHGKMDAVFAASSWLIPHFFGFKGTAAARIFEMNSLAEASVVGMTDWDSERAYEERIAA
jgi:hypothetical protein